MANVTISDLPSLSTMTSSAVIPVDTGANTYQISGANLKNYFGNVSLIANGTSNVSIPTANNNVLINTSNSYALSNVLVNDTALLSPTLIQFEILKSSAPTLGSLVKVGATVSVVGDPVHTTTVQTAVTQNSTTWFFSLLKSWFDVYYNDNIINISGSDSYQWIFDTSGNLTSPAAITTTGNITGGNANITGTTASTSKTSGALTVAGGVGVAGDLYAGNITGGNANITGTTASTSKTTGALKVAGGIGVAGDLYAGNSIVVDGGAYGNVTTTQFASIFGSGSGPNPQSLMQVRGSDGIAGMGIRAYTGQSEQIYANSSIVFTIGATIRDKDTPSGGTTSATLNSTGLSVTGNITAINVKTTPIALSNLTATAGVRAFINDGNLAAAGNFGVQVSGGASNTIPVWSDGTNWYIG